jgi:hypothetical protein
LHGSNYTPGLNSPHVGNAGIILFLACRFITNILNNNGRQHEFALNNINLMNILELVYAVLVASKFKTIHEEFGSSPSQFTNGISLAIF